MGSTDLISAMSIFDPQHLPTKEKLTDFLLADFLSHRKDTNPYQFLQCRTKDPILGRSRHFTTAEDTESDQNRSCFAESFLCVTKTAPYNKCFRY